MQPPEKKHRQTDYTHQLQPRRHSMDGLSASAVKPMFNQAAAPKVHSKPALRQSDNEEYRVSININLPDYSQWRVTKFARHYPYLSIGLAVLSLLAFALFTEGLVALWHHFTHHPVKAAVMIMPGVI